MVTQRMRNQMAVPFHEQCIAYDKVMGHSGVKGPTILVISLTISEATMDFLKPISSPAYVTIPVATRNKNLTMRNLGYDHVQLVIKMVLLCFRPALLGSVHFDKSIDCLPNDKLE